MRQSDATLGSARGVAFTGDTTQTVSAGDSTPRYCDYRSNPPTDVTLTRTTPLRARGRRLKRSV